MRRFTLVITIWTLVIGHGSLLRTGAAEKKKVVATLTNVQGSVETKAQGAKDWTVAKSSQHLDEGDAVRVGKGGKATLIQTGCPLRILKEDEAVVVSANKKWSNGGKPVAPAQHNALIRVLDNVAKSSPSQATVTRPVLDRQANAKIALSPCNENVLDGRPTFAWKNFGDGSRYDVEVFEADDQLIWETKTMDAKIAFPSDRAPLKAGRYKWQIYAKTAAGRYEADYGEFTVLDAANARKIRDELAAAQSLASEDSTVNLPLISLYVDRKLYTQAEAALQRALKLTPDDETLKQLLMHVYGLSGRMRAER